MKTAISQLLALRFFIPVAMGTLTGSLSLTAQTHGVAGPLYNMTYNGGNSANPYGTLNVFDPVTNKDSAVFAFNFKDGRFGYGNLVQYKNGTLYGMTSEGGANAVPNNNNFYGGVIYRYNIVTGQDTVVYNFNVNDTSASTPFGTLLIDSNGFMYGLTCYNGENPACKSCSGSGTIFSFDPVHNTEQDLFQMRNATTGGNPLCSFIQLSGTHGTILYATASASNSDGSIFTYNTGTNTPNKVYNFPGGLDGNYPRGNLTQVGDTLYGLTVNGGQNGVGVLFSYAINQPGIVYPLVSFDVTNGEFPEGSLLLVGDSDLYGTTSQGGSSLDGVLFKYSLIHRKETVVINFNYNNGANPYGNVIMASDGLLYGSTTYGGGPNQGVIFSYNIATGKDSTRFTYDTAHGQGGNPYGDFLEAMSVSLSIVNNRCAGLDSGSIKANVRGAVFPVTYQWSNGNTTDSISPLTSGTYTCTVTDARGIAITIPGIVTGFPIVISFQPGNPCYGSLMDSVGSSIVGGTGPFKYKWSDGQTRDTLYYAPPGTYTLDVTDAHGCPASSTVAIKEAGPLRITGYTYDSTSCKYCNDGKITVHVTGGIPFGDSSYYFYLWSNGGGPLPGDSTLSHQSADTFQVCVTSPYGCGSVCDTNLIILTGIIPNLKPGDLSNSLRAYPIPSNGLFTLNWGGAKTTWSIEVYNVLGLKIFSSYNMEDPTYYLDLSNQPDGVYLLHVISANGVFIKKLLIQK